MLYSHKETMHLVIRCHLILMDQKQKENWVQHLGLFYTACRCALFIRIYPMADKAQLLIPTPSYPCKSWGRWCLQLDHQCWYPEGYSVPNLCHLCRFFISLTCLMQKGNAGLIHPGAGCGMLHPWRVWLWAALPAGRVWSNTCQMS